MRITERSALSKVLLSLSVVILLAVAAGGFLLYRSTGGQGTTVNTSEETVTLTVADAKLFGAGTLSMIRLDNGNFTLTLRATGVQPASAGDYVVQAAEKSGAFSTVPIAGTGYGALNSSAFAGDTQGNGYFSITLSEDPGSIYDLISISFLPGGVFRNGTVVATCDLTPLASPNTTSNGSGQPAGSSQGNPITALELYNAYNMGGTPKDDSQLTGHAVYATGKLNAIINFPNTKQVETGIDTGPNTGTNTVEYWYWNSNAGLPEIASEQTVLAKCVVEGLVSSPGTVVMLNLTNCTLISIR